MEGLYRSEIETTIRTSRARLAARERLRALKLDGPDVDVKDPAWARLLKWWLTPYPDRPPFP